MLVPLVIAFVMGAIGQTVLAPDVVAGQHKRGVIFAQTQATPELARLIGRWVRPDGGYVIHVQPDK